MAQPQRPQKCDADEISPEEDVLTPEMSSSEHNKAERHSALRPDVVHEAIMLEGNAELEHSPEALAWSGLAAGLSMGMSLVAEGLIRSHLPHARWTPLGKFGYSFGYLIVVLGGRYSGCGAEPCPGSGR